VDLVRTPNILWVYVKHGQGMRATIIRRFLLQAIVPLTTGTKVVLVVEAVVELYALPALVILLP
jgi:hypothetical protein